MEHKLINELKLLLNSGQNTQAFALIKQIQVQADPETCCLAAHYLHKNNHISQAKQLSMQVIAAKPDFVPSLITLGQIASAEQDEQLAKSYYEQAIAVEPNCSSAYHNLAVMYERNLELEQAKTHYQKAYSCNQNLNSLLRSGICAQKLAEHAAAIKIFLQAKKQQPDNANILYYLGLSYQQSQMLSQATKAFESALLIAADHVEAQHALATIQAHNQQYELATTSLLQVLKIAPNHGEALHNLASIYYHQSHYKKALDAWLRLLSLQPDQYTNYNIGSCYLALQRHDDAKAYLEAACADLPNSTDPLLNLASIYIKNKDWPKAIKLYQTALELKPDSAEIKYVLAAILQKKHNFTKAPDDYVTHLFDHYADSFEEHLVGNLAYRAHTIIADALNEQIEPNKQYRILDLGCGTGLCGQACVQFAEKLIGVDLSSKMLQQAQKLNIYHELIESELELYLEQARDFQIIMAADVMPYIGDLTTTLELIWQALAPGGFCIFTVEASAEQEFYSLSESGRYQHNNELLLKFVQENWQVITNEKVVTRTQNFIPVSSMLFFLKKPSC